MPGLAGWLQQHVKMLATVLLACAVGIPASHFLWTNEKRVVETKLLPPDTPPAEYLYLDSSRVLAYLGQVVGGLTQSEKRLVLEKEATTASVKGGLLADISGSAERQSSVEETVTPAATDRFFKLLILLRSGRAERGGKSFAWMRELNADIDPGARGPRQHLLDRSLRVVSELHEGDFVRIADAELALPAYAALAPRTRYAARLPSQPVTGKEAPQPSLSRLEKDVRGYLRLLGPDPVLPFVVRTRIQQRTVVGGPTFFVPARYSALLDNARLLAGKLTVVGKVVYVDPRRAAGCSRGARRKRLRCSYVDTQTVVKFAPALQRAARRLLTSLGIPRHTDILGAVSRSVQFSAPIAVVLPVAIYQ